ncbi:aminotransferase class V-fold PLP-dependent enzyme [Halomonas cerina]|uniref:Cysteine sulfinate desulfinase/cysteine desulfurase-like protein n=1 Tax=Halomonas cerina TaxID=447424 RepID=A0A839V8N1_9GAMM|nr:aminotransferase class V-fold PLP-dependent enzyme [Halomonas cerina]MBB3189839.1 cysteine sulfinate desulfinase/cysteine desulfurase-like protein [Halomonas cerina]
MQTLIIINDPPYGTERLYNGLRLTIVPVDATGQVSAQAVVDAVHPDTALVSIMLANNEVGTLQPVADIARQLAGRGVLLHTDSAQAVGKIAIDVEALGIDLLTIAGHQFQASKGIGALYVLSMPDTGPSHCLARPRVK